MNASQHEIKTARKEEQNKERKQDSTKTAQHAQIQQHRESAETIDTMPVSHNGGSPQDWEKKHDPVSGKPFYFNLKTNIYPNYVKLE